MKVLRKGEVPNPNIHTCDYCNCEFEITSELDLETEEVEYEEFDHSLYMNEWHIKEWREFVYCPTCNQKIIIHTRERSREMIPFSERWSH